MDPVNRRKARGVKMRARKAAKARRPSAPPRDDVQAREAHQPGRVVTFTSTPERVLERAARKFLQQPTDRCIKCGSTFVRREPAFIHCHYCGKMARIANASLGDQELFELRAGLRLAS
jgi:hypothetical protein